MWTTTTARTAGSSPSRATWFTAMIGGTAGCFNLVGSYGRHVSYFLYDDRVARLRERKERVARLGDIHDHDTYLPVRGVGLVFAKCEDGRSQVPGSPASLPTSLPAGRVGLSSGSPASAAAAPTTSGHAVAFAGVSEISLEFIAVMAIRLLEIGCLAIFVNHHYLPTITKPLSYNIIYLFDHQHSDTPLRGDRRNRWLRLWLVLGRCILAQRCLCFTSPFRIRWRCWKKGSYLGKITIWLGIC